MLLCSNMRKQRILFTMRQLDICDHRTMAAMSLRVSGTISRVKGTTWNAQRYQITAVGEGQAAKQGLVGDSFNHQQYVHTHVREDRNTFDHSQQQHDVHLLHVSLNREFKGAQSFENSNITLSSSKKDRCEVQGDGYSQENGNFGFLTPEYKKCLQK